MGECCISQIIVTFVFLIKNFQYKEYITSHLFSANIKSPVLCVGRRQTTETIPTPQMCAISLSNIPCELIGEEMKAHLLSHIVTLRQGFPAFALLIFWVRQPFVMGALLCIIGCSATSLTSIYEMPMIPQSCDNQKYLQVFPIVSS